MTSGVTSDGRVVENYMIGNTLYTSQRTLCKDFGISVKTFRRRRELGLSVEDSLKKERLVQSTKE